MAERKRRKNNRYQDIDTVEALITDADLMRSRFMSEVARQFGEMESTIAASKDGESSPKYAEAIEKIGRYYKDSPEFVISRLGMFMDCYASAILKLMIENNKLLIKGIKTELEVSNS